MLSLTILIIFLSGVNCLDFNMFNRYFSKNRYSSKECQLQKELFVKLLKNRTEWAVSSEYIFTELNKYILIPKIQITVLDASGLIPHAITQGNVYDLGMYDQCLKINEETANTTIKGKYCSGGLAIPMTDVMEMESSEATNSTETLFISTCLPDACYPSDFFGKYGNNDNCKTKNQSLDAGDIAFLIFISVVLLAMIVSTAYDIYLQKYSKVPQHKILLAFSVYTNSKKIIRVNQLDQISIFNGMKVISMFWIILGHRFECYRIVAVNKAEFEEWKTEWDASYVLLYRLSVDTFFFISAVLLTSSFLKLHKHSKKSFNIFSLYLHRYFRLTPALAALYFFYITLLGKMVSGPYTSKQLVSNPLAEHCKERWWSIFLYIQNYVYPYPMCMKHTWYIDVDMQFILISPLVLILLMRYPKHMTYVVLPILIIITTMHPMLITYLFKLTLYSVDFKEKYYWTAHMRLSEWLVGIMFGAFLADYGQDKLKSQIKSKTIHLLLWLLVFSISIVQLFIEIKVRQNNTVLNTMLYYPLQRTIWTLCLCWISYACLSGNATLINRFLSLQLFQVLSKICYSTYLVHLVIIALHVNNSQTLSYFSHYELIRFVIADVAISLMVGTFWALAFEYPGINIEQVIFGQSWKNNNLQDERPSLPESAKTEDFDLKDL